VATLRRFVSDHGGYVHPALRQADPAPCGARGVVFSEDVDLSGASAGLQLGSLVVVPSALQLTGAHACALFERLLGASSGPSCLSHFDHVQQVAAGLAYEHGLGADSLWVTL
jgi:hypothetical protein